MTLRMVMAAFRLVTAIASPSHSQQTALGVCETEAVFPGWNPGGAGGETQTAAL